MFPLTNLRLEELETKPSLRRLKLESVTIKLTIRLPRRRMKELMIMMKRQARLSLLKETFLTRKYNF